MRKILGVMLVSLLLTQLVKAQEGVFRPSEITVGSLKYLNGGIGSDEAAAMKKAASDYPLELVFIIKTPTSEQYVADVHVSVTDAKGARILDTFDAGPFLLLKLPSGAYGIEANINDVIKKQTVFIKNGTHQRLVFAWRENAHPATDINDIIAPAHRVGPCHQPQCVSKK